MYMTIGILFGVIVLFSSINFLVNRRWKLLYTAFGYEQYFKIVAKLKSEGIKFKTETPIGAIRTAMTFNDHTQYDIYVKDEDKSRAARAIQ